MLKMVSVFKDCVCGFYGAVQEKKFKTSIIAGLVFLIISSPEMYKLTSSVFKPLATNGCPSEVGLMVHTSVFILITWIMMNLDCF